MANEGSGLPDSGILENVEDSCYVALTSLPLDLTSLIDRVRSPKAGAIVFFAGTTRDNFQDKPVKELQYTAYPALAIRTLSSIARRMHSSHGLVGLAIVHRLGVVPIGEESILIAVSAPHRQAAWRAGEDALEECKLRLEVWKKEEFWQGQGIWRANAQQSTVVNQHPFPATNTDSQSQGQ